MRLRSAACAVLLTLFASPSMAASFDCTKASSFAEKEICRDGYLSGLDNWLARSYKSALEVNPDQADAVRQSQREWLLGRNACTAQKCLDQAIGSRIKQLDDYVSQEKGRASAAVAEARRAQQQALEAERQEQLAQRAAEQARDHQARLDAQRQQAAASAPLYQSPQPAAQPAQRSSAATVSAPAQASVVEKTEWQKFKGGPAWKYLLLSLALLTGWAMWRHHQGVTTIYNDYTDAAITNLLPAAGVVIGLLLKWLELPGQVAMIASMTGFVLALMYAVYASGSTNEGALSIGLSIIAKVFMISIFYALIAFLVASLFSSTRHKGESQARADARNRRQRKQTMALIATLTTAYTFLSGWLCRRQEFVPVSECLAFQASPSPA